MIEQRKQKEYEELGFRDDFMFGKVMEDRELCREVLECLLQRPIGELTEVQTQREFKYLSDGKPIRLDVYSEDSDGIVYDTEMQNLNNKTVEYHQLPFRSRFYQSAIDSDCVYKGQSYKKLPESNIVFICTFDPYKKGLSKYTFRERCDEDSEIVLGDKTTKVFYNCTYKGKDLPEDLKSLYEYVETGKTGTDLTKKIETAIEKGRKNEIWRSQYMKEMTIIMDAKEEGREEGREDERISQISNMLSRGKTIDEIVDFCNYPYDQVKKVAEGLMTKA